MQLKSSGGQIKDATGVTFAHWARATVLDGLAPMPGVPRVVAYSGKPGGLDHDEAAAAFAAWSPAGRQRLDNALTSTLPAFAQAGARLLVVPRLGDVLSDLPGCLSLLRQRAQEPIGIALDPLAMIDPASPGTAQDHLERIADTLLGHPGVELLLVRASVSGIAGLTLESYEKLFKIDPPGLAVLRV